MKRENILIFFNRHKVIKKIIKPFYVLFRNCYAFIQTYCLFQIRGMLRCIRSFVDKNSFKELKQLKNSATKDRCFIIATGPSLRVEDVIKLSSKGEITFGLNSIYKMYERENSKPSYYVCADDHYVKDLLKTTNNSFFDDKASMYSFTDLSVSNKEVRKRKKLIFIPYNRMLHSFRTFLDYHFKFSLNPIFGLYDYYTVTGLAINIAAYMGFKKIYLIGVDCNYMGKAMHAKGIETGKENLATDEYNIYAAYSMKKGYEYLNKKLLKRGIQVINATRGGALEVFPRVNLDDVLEK